MSQAAPKVLSISLYQSGVGYVTRQGPVRGSFTLRIRTEHVNDVLASISTKGPIQGVSFESRKDPREELARRNLTVNPKEFLRNLCEGKLRGHEVTVQVGPVGHADSKMDKGTVMGLDSESGTGPDGKSVIRTDYVVLNTAAGLVRYDLSDVEAILPTDAAIREDLEFYANSARTDARTRDLSVRVKAGKKASQVEISHLVPSPVWNTKYDLDCADGSDTGTLTVWAVAHNPLDEELKGVTLRFATGRPVSFQAELHEPKTPVRTMLQQDMTVDAPVQYESAVLASVGSSRRAMNASARPASASRGLESMGGGPESFMATAAAATAFDMVESETHAEVADAGEESEYVINDVNMPPSGAITLPLIRRTLPAVVRRVWRDGTGTNPEIAIRLTNGADLVLEKGACAIRLDSKFVGQAVLPYTPRSAEMYLPFAKDQSLKVNMRRSNASSRVVRVGLGDPATRQPGYLVQEVVEGVEFNVEVRSLHRKPVELILELPRLPGYDLAPIAGDTITVRTATASHWRLSVTVPVGTAPLAFSVRALMPSSVSFYVNNMNDATLQSWVQSGALSDSLQKGLARVVALAKKVGTATATQRKVANELQTANAQEEGLIKKVKDLGVDAPTAKARFTADLETVGATINTLRTKEAAASADLNAAREEYNAALENLSDDATKVAANAQGRPATLEAGARA